MSVDTNPVARSIRLLHVDDDESLLSVTAAFLEQELPSVEVESVTDTDTALQRLDAEPFDCVVSDYEMPGIDGLDFLREVRDSHPELPFLLFTGKGSETIASRAINAGVTGYVQKGGPEQQRRLTNRVEHAIEEYRAKLDSERYSTVLEALDYPVYVVDADGRFEHVNEAFAALTGYDQTELVGTEPRRIKSDESVTRVDEALSSVVSSSGPDTARFDVEIRTKDGETVHCRDHLAPLPFEDEYRGCAGILRDTTAERQRRHELARQNERLEEFVSVVSHDLRTPLTTAETAAELAQRTGESQYFEKLDRAHDRIERLLEDLLTLAREGEGVIATESVPLRSLADQAWQSVGAEAASMDVRTELAVEANPDRLRRLFENLFRNALEHGSPTASITVDDLDGPETGFYVADDGAGIPADVRDSVFDPGYTTADDGTGFGLSIVRRISDAHGWETSVSESSDGGARFEFDGVEVRSPARSSP